MQEVILLSLICSMESERHHPSMDHHIDTQAAILAWLLQELSTPHPTGHAPALQAKPSAATCTGKLWKQSPKLLAQVSKHHLEFFKVHIKYLVMKMEQLEMEFCQVKTPGMAVSNCLTVEEEFEEVVAHFHQLVLSGDNVKEVCISLVKSKALSIEGGSEGKLLQFSGWRRLHLRLDQV